MKPDDIPEDIMRLAEDYYLDAVVMTTEDEPRAMVLMLSRAILAERERCLRVIAEQKRAFMSPEYAYPQPIGSLSEQFACDQIAAAIRQPREGNGG